MNNNYNFKLVSGNFNLGETITVEKDGKLYKRVVRDNRECGLYIVINNIMHFEYDCDYTPIY